ncbi:FAD-binding oxidoreductase [Microbacterium sp. NPDC056057]|uniref:FAD-binding oxidoreductase n=1 Tax=Microbacterium sp. NPDC056057 TaxID=3345699 RepID=UPI0035E384B9
MSSTLTITPIEQLADAVECDVLYPGSSEYDLARRLWNADIDRRPAAIVRVRNAEDVSAALRWSTAHGYPITVRSGGHNLAGTAAMDGAVQIDTRLINDIEIDQDAGLIRVGGGCNWGQVDRACEGTGLVVPAGVVSHTGVAGLTLGGGFGYLARQHGATVDHLESIEVVVADGSILDVSATSHPDLFRAMKGAGHNYGVATRFTFRPQRLAGLATVRLALFAADDRRAIMQRFAERGIGMPSEVGTYLRLYRAPEFWSQIPAEHRGRPILSLATIRYGDPADEPAATAPIFEGFTPIYLDVRTMPHVTLQHQTDDEFRYGLRHYWKHTFIEELTDDVIDTIIEQSDVYPGRALNSSAFISHQVMCPFEIIAGPGTARAGHDDALPTGRVMNYSANIGADWEYPSEKAPLVEWARGFSDALAPSKRGTYINFASVQGDDEVAKAVYGAKYEDLAATKRRYDPENVFRRGLVDLSDPGDDKGADA